LIIAVFIELSPFYYYQLEGFFFIATHGQNAAKKFWDKISMYYRSLMFKFFRRHDCSGACGTAELVLFDLMFPDLLMR
jgi:hypothetical protein